MQRMTARETVDGFTEAGKVYEGMIAMDTAAAFHFIFFVPRSREWRAEPLYKFVPIGEFINEPPKEPAVENTSG